MPDLTISAHFESVIPGSFFFFFFLLRKSDIFKIQEF